MQTPEKEERMEILTGMSHPARPPARSIGPIRQETVILTKLISH